MKIIHWIFTGLVAAMFLMSAGMYIVKHDTDLVPMFEALGFPVWLIYPMAIAKALGAIMLLTKFNKTLTEWAYAGIVFNMLLAFGAHVSVGDGEMMPPLIALLLAMGSYFTWKKLEKLKA